jgi:hypothetical protein
LEIGSEAANRIMLSIPEDMLIFVSGSSMFIKGLSDKLGRHSCLVLSLNMGN